MLFRTTHKTSENVRTENRDGKTEHSKKVEITETRESQLSSTSDRSCRTEQARHGNETQRRLKRCRRVLGGSTHRPTALVRLPRAYTPALSRYDTQFDATHKQTPEYD